MLGETFTWAVEPRPICPFLVYLYENDQRKWRSMNNNLVTTLEMVERSLSYPAALDGYFSEGFGTTSDAGAPSRTSMKGFSTLVEKFHSVCLGLRKRVTVSY